MASLPAPVQFWHQLFTAAAKGMQASPDFADLTLTPRPKVMKNGANFSLAFSVPAKQLKRRFSVAVDPSGTSVVTSVRNWTSPNGRIRENIERDSEPIPAGQELKWLCRYKNSVTELVGYFGATSTVDRVEVDNAAEVSIGPTETLILKVLYEHEQQEDPVPRMMTGALLRTSKLIRTSRATFNQARKQLEEKGLILTEVVDEKTSTRQPKLSNFYSLTNAGRQRAALIQLQERESSAGQEKKVEPAP
jgi:DNA-binding MarR family transcriptional regulator